MAMIVLEMQPNLGLLLNNKVMRMFSYFSGAILKLILPDKFFSDCYSEQLEQIERQGIPSKGGYHAHE